MESDSKQSDFFYKAWAWAETHLKQILWGAILIVVISIVAGFALWHANAKEADANDALSRAVSPTVVGGAAATPEALLKVASDYSGTSAAARALLLGASDLFAEGKYPESQAQFEIFLREYPGSSFTGQASLGVAACLDAQGKTNEAIIAYNSVIDHHANEMVVFQAKFARARLYEAQNKLEAARQDFEEVNRNSPNSSIGSEAGIRYEELISKHPELAPTNVPPARISAPAPGPKQP